MEGSLRTKIFMIERKIAICIFLSMIEMYYSKFYMIFTQLNKQNNTKQFSIQHIKYHVV